MHALQVCKKKFVEQEFVRTGKIIFVCCLQKMMY